MHHVAALYFTRVVRPVVPDPTTILVVGDDLSVLSGIKCMLERGDYNVLIAQSAEIALRVADREELSIDLMLIDVLMPDITGPDLAERIQAIRPHQKVLFITGRNESKSDGLLQKVQNALGHNLAGLLSVDPDGGGGTPVPSYTGPRLQDCPTRVVRRPRNPDLKG
jgi:CheY-like chemotaxis protein